MRPVPHLTLVLPPRYRHPARSSPIVLVGVEEPRDLLLQLGRAARLPQGNRAPEELALGVGRQIVPPRDDRGAEILGRPLLRLVETRLPVVVFRRGPAREAALVVPAGEDLRRLITRARIPRFLIDHATGTGSRRPSAGAWSGGRVTVERLTAPPAPFVPRSAVRRQGREECAGRPALRRGFPCAPARNRLVL